MNGQLIHKMEPHFVDCRSPCSHSTHDNKVHKKNIASDNAYTLGPIFEAHCTSNEGISPQ